MYIVVYGMREDEDIVIFR